MDWNGGGNGHPKTEAGQNVKGGAGAGGCGQRAWRRRSCVGAAGGVAGEDAGGAAAAAAAEEEEVAWT